jgi:hypothetical protein
MRKEGLSDAFTSIFIINECTQIVVQTVMKDASRC